MMERQDSKSQFNLDVILSALDLIEEGVMIISSIRTVEYMNKSAVNIFSPVQNTAERPTFIEIARDHECEEVLRNCIKTGHEQSAVIRLYQDNKLLQLNILAVAEKQYIAVIKDLTERRQLEQIQRDLISNMSHEFRTPIASIRLLAETVLDDPEGDKKIRQDFLEKIVIETDKLSRMTDDMKELAAIEKRGSLLERGSTDISRIIEQAVQRLAAQARKKQINISTSIESSLPRVLVDAERIESVLINLIHNAIKFMGQGGNIAVRAVRDGNCVLVSISDTGCGIPPDQLPRIFERFYKVDKSRTGEGSGLGLSISKHIINAHGGKIWAESVEGKGSVFYFTLPVLD